ncbi:MAG TPA: FAD-dependent monooxygenase [Thermoanaerobaculia bacterium]|jgi:2-polyprenyl-6-methoxyphenol hydroxylase-like FAD-dependent oxidoreductase
MKIASPQPLERADVLQIPQERPEVLVAGAGPVGLMAALALAEQGIQVQIVDQERRPAARSYALALHPQSLRLLDEVGLAEELLARAHRIERLAFYEGMERRAELDFTALPAEFPFVAVLPQQILEGTLESALKRRGVPVLWNHRLVELHLGGGGAAALVERHGPAGVEDGFDVRPEFLIGADGHRSIVRHALQASYVEMAPAELFAVFELVADGPPEGEARVVFSGSHTGVLWPLGGRRYRWSLQVDEWEGFEEPRFKSRLYPEVGDEPFPYLVRDKLRELTLKLAPWFEADLGEIVWSMAVRFERRLAGRFGHGKAWLAGDAAHLASPVGAQSMNVGIREAYDLARRLGFILREDYPRDLLESYAAAHRHEWRQLLGARGKPEPGPSTDPWVRKHAARLLPCVPGSGDDLILLLRQLGLVLPVDHHHPD